MEKLTPADYLFALKNDIDCLREELKNDTGDFMKNLEKYMELEMKKDAYKQVLNNTVAPSYNLVAGTEKSSEFSNLERKQANNFFLQKNHNENLHRKILLKYSKCAAIAPAESEELASAINNRSEFLLHLKKYQNCINDIDYALPFTKSDVLKARLLCRKVICLLSMNKENEAKKISDEASKIFEHFSKEDEDIKNKLTQKLKDSFNKKYKIYKSEERKGEKFDLIKSKKLPYLSEAVSIKYNSRFGKHMVANRDIKTGEILIVEKPYCIYPSWAEYYTVCSHCLKLVFNSIPCKKCIFAIYCSEKCEKEAFEEYHDIECAINPSLFKSYSKNTAVDFELNVFFARLFIKLIKDVGIKKIIEDAKVIDATKEKDKIIYDENGDVIVNNYNPFQHFYRLLDEAKTWPDILDAKFPQTFLELLKNLNYFPDELNEKNMPILRNIFFKIMLKHQSHGTEISATKQLNFHNDDNTPVVLSPLGQALTQLSTFLNHNCYSNAGKYYLHEGKHVIYAIRPIKKDEQVYLKYCSGLDIPKSVRTSLLEQYKVKCNCIACVNNWPPHDDKLTQVVWKKFCKDENKYKDILEVIKVYLSFEFDKGYGPWKFDKKSIKLICDVIEKSYKFHYTVEGAAIIYRISQILDDLHSIVYNDYFNIPNKC